MSLFNGILSDLFPGIVLKEVFNDVLIDEMKFLAQKGNYGISEEFNEKIKYFDDLIRIRFGVIVVGSPMTGKSTLIKLIS